MTPIKVGGLPRYCKQQPTKEQRRTLHAQQGTILTKDLFPFSNLTDSQICNLFEEWHISLGVTDEKKSLLGELGKLYIIRSGMF